MKRDKLASTPRSPRGKIEKGEAAKAEIREILRANGATVYRLSPNEPGAAILAALPSDQAFNRHWLGIPVPIGLTRRTHVVFEVKSRPWAYIGGDERRACLEAAAKAQAALSLYWAVCPVPGRRKEAPDGPREWEVIFPCAMPVKGAQQVRILSRWPFPRAPAQVPAEAGYNPQPADYDPFIPSAGGDPPPPPIRIGMPGADVPTGGNAH